MARKLVTVRTIGRIESIAGADRIELATIDGWKCITRKGDFSVGERVVYIESDSFLPIVEPFLFLENVKGSRQVNAQNETGYKIRVHHMGPKENKKVSNGLVLKLADMKHLVPDIESVPVGTDLTVRIGAKVYEKSVDGDIAFGGMPSSVKQTDQERIQNMMSAFSEHKSLEFEATEKIDGTSCSFYLSDGKFGACNRTLDLKNTRGCKHWDYAIAHGIEKAMRDFGKNIALQGELAGEGIEDNRLKLKGVHFFLFDVWDIDNRRYYTPQERKDVFEWFRDTCGMEHVPVIDPCIAPFEQFVDADAMVEYATGPSVLVPSRQREGIVFKSNDLVDGQVVSFKVISDVYKIKHGT